MSEMNALKGQLLRIEIIAQCPDLINETASDYVAGLMRQWYTINDDGEFVQTNQTPLRTQDFKPMAVDEIGDYLRQTPGYLFKSGPSGNSVAKTEELPLPNKSQMSLEEKCRFIRLNGQQAYESLPNSPVEALPLVERPRSTWTMGERADYIHRFGMDAYLSLLA